MSTSGSRYHGLTGMCRATALGLHGTLRVPARLRPTRVPTSVSGNAMNAQMKNTATMVITGIAARDWYAIAIALSANDVAKHTPGNSAAVAIIVTIQRSPCCCA
eukprot:Amastigsp_a174436_467.p5 type:complete len:104 gc:universal Amastigsp_a174436_467:446-757(+)